MTRKQAALSGFGWGCVAGAALVAVMYYAALLLGLRPLPGLLNEPLLSLMPGFVFGFLIDNLQHAGKVLEEAGLIVAMVLALGVLGAVSAIANLRWTSSWLPFVFAGAGWLLVCTVLLPVGGAGMLGLNDGPATPLTWAALFAIYAVVLQYGGQGPYGVDMGWRRLLSAVPISIAAISIGGLALRLLPDWYAAIFNSPESALRGISPDITPVQNFYVVSKNIVGYDPTVDGQAWRLHVSGMVDKPMTLSLGDLRALSPTEEYVTFACVSNNVGGDLMSTGQFTGVRLRDLVAGASPQGGASWVGFRARDGYTESLPLSTVEGTPEILVAYDLDGAPLPMVHGFPARLVIPGHYGMKAPKWLDTIELSSSELRGFWEQQGWDHNAVVKTTARFDVPRDGDIVRIGAIEVGGVAFAGTRGVSKVEITTNDSTWTQVSLDPPLSNLTWVRWRTVWTPASEGVYRLRVRATDGSGQRQDPSSAPSFPSGASGYHTIQVSVSK